MGYVRCLLYIIATCFAVCIPSLLHANSTYIKLGEQAPNSTLLGIWRGQEDDIILELEFKKDGSMIIKDINSHKIKVFKYSVSGGVLRTVDSRQIASTQFITIRGNNLNLRKPNLKRSESIDILYSLTFHRIL